MHTRCDTLHLDFPQEVTGKDTGAACLSPISGKIRCPLLSNHFPVFELESVMQGESSCPRVRTQGGGSVLQSYAHVLLRDPVVQSGE